MPAGGWISKWAFQDNALTADADGQAAMADSYILNRMISDATITAVKLASGVLNTGVYGVGTYGTSVYG